MNIGIVHITDMHFTVKTHYENRMDSIAKVIINDFHDVETIYIVISGDIAWSGKKEEYLIAKKFLSILKQMITSELKLVSVKYIMVPGNHDCNFEKNNQVRSMLVNAVNYDNIIDKSLVEQCLVVQNDFWDFYKLYNNEPEDKLFYKVTDKVSDKEINFHCINTSWISKLEEVPGSLFYPCKIYDVSNLSKQGFNFCVWHHPINWFNPNTTENNKNEFEHFIEHISSTHFIGHEHVQMAHSNENLNTGKRVNILSGEIFNEDKKTHKSGFQNIIVDLDTEVCNRKVYSWKGEYYSCIIEKDLVQHKDEIKGLSLSLDFVNSLMEIKIPLVVDYKKDIKLSDLFVFQDLESSYKESNKLDNYFNSFKLIEKENSFSVLDGDSQVGKSSLLSMLFVKMYENDIYPILLKGSDIKDNNLEKLINKSFKIQYKKGNSIDRYLQLPKSKRAILIDDYHNCEFNSVTTKKFFNEISQKFGISIVVIDSANSLVSSLKTEIKDVKYYTIKPLGFKKRNELIERFLQLKKNPLTFNEHAFLNEVKDTFDNVQSVLGDKLMPSYPIYVLSIIQSLQYKPLKNETSFGYCYQTLIHYSLFTSGVSNDDIDSYFNILTELAYLFLKNEVDVFSHKDMLKFYTDYSERFICPPYDSAMYILKKSNILKSDDNGVCFGYNYILYYLSAKKISDLMHENEGTVILEKLFDNLHEEKNANVLVFITHHSKDISFIESSLLTLMNVLDKTLPITLEKDDPYYKDISSFVQNIKNDVIDVNRNHKNERERMLINQDNILREKEKEDKITYDDEETKKMMLPLLKSFRSIEIVGQIIKNRKGSLEIQHLNSMLTELYTTSFRTITFFNEVLNSAKADIIEAINEKVEEGDTKRQIEERISSFLQYVNFRMCLVVFGKLTQCAGNKELKKLYTEVANTIGTPAAKIVTFGINLSYSSLNMNELSQLVDEFKGNIVALRLLKARVRSYVYNKNIDYLQKQKIASTLKMELSTKPFSHNKNDSN